MAKRMATSPRASFLPIRSRHFLFSGGGGGGGGGGEASPSPSPRSVLSWNAAYPSRRGQCRPDVARRGSIEVPG